jgi:hypothetical protein
VRAPYYSELVRWLGVVLAVAAVACAAEIKFDAVSRTLVEKRFGEPPSKNAERAQALRTLFDEVHCSGDHFEEQRVHGSKLPNLICTLPAESDETILVTAHYDKVDTGGSNGAIDNWTSASLLPSLYQALALQPRKYKLVFIAFMGEETGLLGSKFYAEHLSKDEARRIRALVNVDSIGMTGTEVWVSRADKDLVKGAAMVAHALQLPLTGMNVDQVGDSDSHPFIQRKVPVIDFHSVTSENFHILHSGLDRRAAVNWDAYYESYRLIAGFVAWLSEQ